MPTSTPQNTPDSPDDEPELTLFDTLKTPHDLTVAKAQGEAAMHAAAAAAGAAFAAQALDLMHEYAKTHPEVWADDFLAFAAPRLPPFKGGRALGATYKTGAARGWIEKSGQFRQSASSHGLPKIVWRSLIYAGRTVAA